MLDTPVNDSIDSFGIVLSNAGGYPTDFANRLPTGNGCDPFGRRAALEYASRTAVRVASPSVFSTMSPFRFTRVSETTRFSAILRPQQVADEAWKVN